MIAYRVYQEARGQDYTDLDDLGFFLDLASARAVAAQRAEKENKEALKYLKTDGTMYLDTTLFVEHSPDWWGRKNHVGDIEHIRVVEITIEE